MQVLVKVAALQAVLLVKTVLKTWKRPIHSFIDVRGSISLLLDKFFVAEVEVVVKQILYERSNIFSIPVSYYPKRAPQKVLR